MKSELSYQTFTQGVNTVDPFLIKTGLISLTSGNFVERRETLLNKSDVCSNNRD